jgi:hypothetical protein
MAICGTKTGGFSIKSDTRKSDLEGYGAGIVLYFQFLKYMAIVFLIMTILAIPTCILFYSGNTTYDGNFKGLLTAVSLGNIGEARPSCNTGEVDLETNPDLIDPKISMYLQCNNGYLESLDFFGQGINPAQGKKKEGFVCPNIDKQVRKGTFDFSKMDTDFPYYPADCRYETFSFEEKIAFNEEFKK